MSGSSPVLTIGEVVGKRLVQIRSERGLTQDQLVLLLRRGGLAWTRSNLASLETGRREGITLEEFLLLCRTLETSAHAWFADLAGLRIRVGRVDIWAAELVRDVLAKGSGAQAAPTRSRTGMAATVAVTEIDANAARRLRRSPEDVRGLALMLWGRDLIDERESRLWAFLKDRPSATRAQQSARRSHITRELFRELAEASAERPPGGAGVS